MLNCLRYAVKICSDAW